MDNHVQNGAPVFVASTVNPDVHYTSPVSAHPQTYAIHQQQQPQPSSGKCRSSVAGKIAAIWLGAVLVACGAISNAGAAVAFRFYANLSFVGYGVWCGFTFLTAGAVAIAAGHHETKKLIIGTTVTSCLSIAAAITQLFISSIALHNDGYYDCYSWCYPNYYSCPCYYDNWELSARAADGTMIGAAALAFIAGIWLLVVGCCAGCRKPVSFQKHSTQVQGLHQQQQLMPVSQQLSNASYSPASSQVVQMQLQNNQTTPLTMTTSTIPNQQVLQVPVQLILTASLPTSFQESQSQQMNVMPVQYVQIQQQQTIPVNKPHPNTIAPSASSQEHENPDFPRDDDLCADQL